MITIITTTPDRLAPVLGGMDGDVTGQHHAESEGGDESQHR